MSLELAVAPRDAPKRVTVFVCTSCRGGAGETDTRPGIATVDALERRLREAGAPDVEIRDVECLAVCKRPATIAITAEGSWTYIIGDLDIDADPDGIVETVLAFRRSLNGIVPWAERPSVFRKGVIARIPPRGFVQPVRESA